MFNSWLIDKPAHRPLNIIELFCLHSDEVAAVVGRLVKGHHRRPMQLPCQGSR